MLKNICAITNKKKKSTRAFTLSEVLVAILIMGLATSVVAGAVPAAIRAYQDTQKASDAQMLLSTTLEELRSELGLARDLTITHDTTADTYSVEYKTAFTKSGSGKAFRQATINSNGTDGICITYSGGTAQQLVAVKASDNLVITYGSIEFVGSSHRYIQFNDIAVKDEEGVTLASCDKYSVKTGE